MIETAVNVGPRDLDEARGIRRLSKLEVEAHRQGHSRPLGTIEHRTILRRELDQGLINRTGFPEAGGARTAAHQSTGANP